jgi:hypothetical protein
MQGDFYVITDGQGIYIRLIEETQQVRCVEGLQGASLFDKAMAERLAGDIVTVGGSGEQVLWRIELVDLSHVKEFIKVRRS